MKADLQESIEHLENTAREKVAKAVSERMQAMFSFLKDSDLWNSTTDQIRSISESLAALEAEIYDKLKQPGVDLIEVGLDLGIKVERVLEGIKQIEQNVEHLRMNNSEWDAEIDARLQNLFESLKITGISPVAAVALKGTSATGIQAKVIKALNEYQKSFILQPQPDSKVVGVLMPGIGLGFSV